MNVLVIGAAGKVGRIIAPALEAHYNCRYFDRIPVPGREAQTTVGDVNDTAALADAMLGMQRVVYLAMGVRPGEGHSVYDPDLAFGVNTTGWYKAVTTAMRSGIRHVIYASSMSVHGTRSSWDTWIDDETPATAWDAYGLSKRMGEEICRAMTERYPDATLLALRLFWPCGEEEWAKWLRKIEEEPDQKGTNWQPTGPQDTRRLFLAALACEAPGAHVLQATGDVEHRHYPHTRAERLLGWQPQGV